MKNVLKGLFVLTLLLASIGNIAYADVSINLKIYANDDVLFNGPLTVTLCAESPEEDAPLTLNGKCAVEQSGLSNTFTWSDFDGDGKKTDGFLDELSGNRSDPFYWGWFSNLIYGDRGLNQHPLSDGEELLLTYNSYPLRISASQTSGIVNDTITFTAEEESIFNPNPPYDMLWTPSPEVTVTLGTQSCTTIVDGTCFIVLDTPGSLSAVGSKALYVPSSGINIEVSAPTPPPSSGGGGGGGSRRAKSAPVEEVKAKFDLEKAYEFLIGQQAENGSFGEDLYTDWVALALASGNNQAPVLKLIRHFGESKIGGTLLTDYERRAMALMALGLNPHNTNGENYIEKITGSFDGKQFGDKNQDNDDIFALIVLQNAGYGESDPMIKEGISFVLGAQKENGSWDESVDMTGAAMEALSAFSPIPGVGENLEKAKEFLKQSQKDNGGWNDSAPSTAWALQGILALGEKPEDWEKKNKTPIDFLATLQDTDGGIKDENAQNKIWNTAYVASVLSGKTWNQVMQKFEKPVAPFLPAETPKEVVKKPAVKKIATQAVSPKNDGGQNQLEITTTQNTASAISAVAPSPTETETPEKGWLMRLLQNIFGF